MSDGLVAAKLQGLRHTPILVVFGDHLSEPIEDDVKGAPWTWEQTFKGCQLFAERFRKAGQIDVYHPPKMGIRGNSHMMMVDENSDQIAGLIEKWILLYSRDT